MPAGAEFGGGGAHHAEDEGGEAGDAGADDAEGALDAGPNGDGDGVAGDVWGNELAGEGDAPCAGDANAEGGSFSVSSRSWILPGLGKEPTGPLGGRQRRGRSFSRRQCLGSIPQEEVLREPRGPSEIAPKIR